MLDKTKLPTFKQMAEAAYTAMQGRAVGTRLTYELLTRVCGAEARQLRTRTAVLRAGRKLLHEERLLLLNVRDIGYEIVAPEQHVVEAQRQRKIARRRLKRSMATVVYVRLEGMSPAEVSKVLAEQTRNALLLRTEHAISRKKALPPKADIPTGPALMKLLLKPKATA